MRKELENCVQIANSSPVLFCLMDYMLSYFFKKYQLHTVQAILEV